MDKVQGAKEELRLSEERLTHSDGVGVWTKWVGNTRCCSNDAGSYNRAGHVIPHIPVYIVSEDGGIHILTVNGSSPISDPIRVEIMTGARRLGEKCTGY